MADELDIKWVKANINPDAGTAPDPYNEAYIAELLDVPEANRKEIVRDYWQYRMAHTADYVDITESGSSRQLESIYRHAKELAQYWTDQLKADEAELEEDLPAAKEPIRFHRATRV